MSSGAAAKPRTGCGAAARAAHALPLASSPQPLRRWAGARNCARLLPRQQWRPPSEVSATPPPPGDGPSSVPSPLLVPIASAACVSCESCPLTDGAASVSCEATYQAASEHSATLRIKEMALATEPRSHRATGLRQQEPWAEGDGTEERLFDKNNELKRRR